MPLLKIAKLGRSVLRKIAKPVTHSEYHTPEFQKFLDDMVETMWTLDGVGLAAPQVYRSKQVIVVGTHHNFHHSINPDLPILILLNPTITFMSEEKREGIEGCISLDNLRGKVARSIRIRVTGYDRKMRPVEIDADGFLSIILQHEIDHLIGKVFIDRMTDLTTLSLRGEDVNSIATRKAALFSAGSSVLVTNNPPVTDTGSGTSSGSINSVGQVGKNDSLIIKKLN
ncbi:MAG: peptide deformylase [Nitrospiria bacterium]